MVWCYGELFQLFLRNQVLSVVLSKYYNNHDLILDLIELEGEGSPLTSLEMGGWRISSIFKTWWHPSSGT